MKKNQLFSTALLNVFSSTRITVACLLFLFILTFWGTVAQVTHGLYGAQDRFFNSFYFLAAGFIPFPGAQFVLWVLFLNLIASGITHHWRLRHWRFIGLKVIHGGLLLYFAAAFVTFHGTHESSLRLAEGEGSNVSVSYDQWEIVYWKEKIGPRQLTSIDTQSFVPGAVVKFQDVSIVVEEFYQHCNAFGKALPADGIKPINGSGITLLQGEKLNTEREKNVAGGMFKINGQRVILWGGEDASTKVGPYFFNLRHKTFPLPFTIKLDEFKVQFYPGTQMAKSYESYVSVIQPNATRQVRVYMNNPLRHKDYTFYQASYDTDQRGRQHSTLAVVRNAGRVLPYIACFVVFFGLMAHFLIMAFEKRLRK